MKADIGVIGLAVMGQNLILNMNDNGFNVIAYNRTTQKTNDFINGEAKNTNVRGAYSLEEFVDSLATPRKIMLMVKAGKVVDTFIDKLIPLLDKGDIIIDGGNSNYTDSIRREKNLSEQDIIFIGAGVSGGEEGARTGPSIMPGGNKNGWEHIKPIFQAISAKTDQGEACCNWVGKSGSGHFVKMVHNGIEYGDMQLIAETYHFMKSALNMKHEEMHQVFNEWNKTKLESYLIEITAEILNFKSSDNSPLLESILDVAGQKGTGKWTAIDALDTGIPLTLISESVFARYLSSLKSLRVNSSKLFNLDRQTINAEEKSKWIDALKDALLASKIISYAQGFMLLKEISDQYKWDINLGHVALLWREGCIIRSVFLDNIMNAYAKNPKLDFLGNDDYFKNVLKDCLPNWRKVCAQSANIGLPMPGISSALTFLDGITTNYLPANMIQAQRDYFGAHTYERLDKPRGEFFHTQWIKK